MNKEQTNKQTAVASRPALRGFPQAEGKLYQIGPYKFRKEERASERVSIFVNTNINGWLKTTAGMPVEFNIM